MVTWGKDNAFFFEVEAQFDLIINEPEEAKNKLIARDPVLYKKTMFRAFLGLTKQDTEEMGIGDYLDHSIMLSEVLKLWHAPYMDHSNG